MNPTPAPATLSASDLLDNLKESGLLTAEELDQAAILAAKSSLDAPGLARALVAAGTLTNYQAEAVSIRDFGHLQVGNYDVLDRLGAGGMGTVFKARHRRMKRIVALKVLSKSISKDLTLVQRFQREVETIARLTHNNIVMAYDADEAEAGPFLVMEYVSGQDLDSLVAKNGALSVPAAVHAMLQAARGLEYAHGQGMIHRDIKPANLLSDAQGAIKITDLGLARFNQDASATAPGGMTRQGDIFGTVDYMPPEQAVDTSSIDHRADIYSLGATLHFLLIGVPPYQGQTLMATLLKHRDDPIPSLMAQRPDVPTALDTVFRRMLAKAPADRFQTMTEVVRSLEAIEASLAQQPAAPSGPAQTIVFKASTLAATAAPGDVANQTIGVGETSAFKLSVSKVLLVEPSRTQSGIIAKYLEKGGVQHVVTAATGREALESTAHDRPDVIVSALHLDDMSGVQLAQQIQARGGALPGFILISSKSQSPEAGTISSIPGAVLLQKPFTPAQLMEALRLVSDRQSLSSTAGPRERLRVLVVDDSAPARLHDRQVLAGLGVTQVTEAEDGAHAVAAVAREKFDLIVTDYNMPLMDGGGLVAFLKQNPASAAIPIIMVTTEQDPQKLAAVRRLGVTAICDKSFPAELVGKIIDEILSKP